MKEAGVKFESIHQEVISVERFTWRCLRYAAIAALLLLTGLIPGVVGFVYLADLPAAQAWLNALSMVSGLEFPYPIINLHLAPSLHLFLAFYSLFIETVFFVSLATLFAPIIHRVFHRMHCIEESD
ncbi:hypothetical protein DEB41_01555 [Vibrio anguillarum]|uniref:Uncharacterized protein n=1 Tax=Vibrio anguillarum TaxID=55601 RepID=A0AAW4AKE1_VIBAN|nr:hypothetical protein CEA93_14065 [Vibrio anguillarum]ATA48308.1 hypothetical protein CLI14_00665 [Vibrio anguillarum]AXN06182.1 hypothetical protein DEA53_01560 [Vibrio anguillarum]AXN09632.1 hypothetical protein DEB26_01545 [Vibrio anguillarum]AXN13034.1 hypothetical protein DEB41_01555 [Vibrio anguillarum]